VLTFNAVNAFPFRVDWAFARMRENVTDFDKLESPRLALDRFDRILRKWLNEDRLFQRLALGVVVLAPVTDRLEGYRAVQPYLPAVKLSPETSSDFQYQINRPRISTVVTGLKVNRLSHWSVAVQRQIGFVGTLQGLHQAEAFETYACRAALDVNSDADRTEPLPREHVSNLWQEFEGLAIELANGGDVP